MKRLPAILLLASAFAVPLAACDNGSPTPTIERLATPTASPSTQGSNSPTSTMGAIISTPTSALISTPVTSVGSPTPATQATTAATATPEQAVAPEQNPAGDIPDTQAFVKYSSAAGGYEFDAPEGWARSENGPGVSFVDKLDGVAVSITNTASPLTVDSVRANEVVALQKSGRAVQVSDVKAVTLPAGPAILIDYVSNSEPNAVTGKQVRLENNAYLVYKAASSGQGKVATIMLWAPVGADNVDQWQRMSQSFTWR
ncbi:MAG: hypothetical protein ABJA50_12310 [Chloroflexota bacterium]